VLLPDRAVVEALERRPAIVHRGEAAHPHEPVRVVQVAELSDDVDAGRLLPADELAVEERDERIPGPGTKRVLPQLDHLIVVHGRSLAAAGRVRHRRGRVLSRVSGQPVDLQRA
jgi:hypothetical protein